MALLLWVTGAIAAALVGLVLTLLLQDRVSVILVKVLRGFWVDDSNRTVSGIWYSYYAVSPEWGTSPSASASRDAIVVIRLRQIGSKVAGTSAKESKDYIVSASLKDIYLTGTWWNFIDGRNDWGAFQLAQRNREIMTGKFVGRDFGNHINHGIWLWARTAERLKDDLPAIAAGLGYVADGDALKVRVSAALARQKVPVAGAVLDN